MLVAAAVAAAALVLAVRAEASPNVRYGVQDDAWLLAGPGTLDERLTKLDALGVELVRVNLRWNAIAPTRPARAGDDADPAYRWAEADALLQGLRAHDIRPVVTLVGTPRWANGGRTPNWAPQSARSFANFAHVAATRYRFVSDWIVWNEPNQDWQLRPTTPRTYVRVLLNPAYAAIKSVDPGDRVAGGATAPRGDVSYPAWIRGMDRHGARLDAYAHHPHPLKPRLERPLAALDALLRNVSRAWGSKRVWLTEFGYQTNPPDNWMGVSQARQAQFIGEAALRAYRAPRVDMLIHFLVRDELELGRWQSGLFDSHGTAKQSAAAFPLPLAQVSRRGSTTTLWGQVRTGAGKQSYRLRIRVDGRWSWTGYRLTDARGFFAARVTAPRGSAVQLFARGTLGAVLVVR
jgi:hypothetical protein